MALLTASKSLLTCLLSVWPPHHLHQRPPQTLSCPCFSLSQHLPSSYKSLNPLPLSFIRSHVLLHFPRDSLKQPGFLNPAWYKEASGQYLLAELMKKARGRAATSTSLKGPPPKFHLPALECCGWIIHADLFFFFFLSLNRCVFSKAKGMHMPWQSSH